MKNKLVERKIKSVSGMLSDSSGIPIFSKKASDRGIYLHSIRKKYYSVVLKTGYREPVGYTVFRQKMRETTQNLLEETRKNETYSVFYLDAKNLMKKICDEVLQTAKEIAQRNNGRLTPELVETILFGGLTEFEEYRSAEIMGIKIEGKIDEMVYLGTDEFKIGEFKTGFHDDESDPSNPESKNHRDWLQAAIYSRITEISSGRTCKSFRLIYFPNKPTIEYEFDETLRNRVTDYLKENSMEALDFTFTSQRSESLPRVEFKPVPETETETKTETRTEITTKIDGNTTITKRDDIEENGNSNHSTLDDSENRDPIDDLKLLLIPKDPDQIGRLDTTKEKPLVLTRKRGNRMEGYLFANRAAEVKSGYYCAVEKDDGIRIICVIDEIKSYQGRVMGEISSHSEEVYRTILNPKLEMLPEGPIDPRPQTISNGKIMKLREEEFFQMKQLSQVGMRLGQIVEGSEGKYQYSFDPIMLFQSLFAGGVQGTGKTTFLKELTLLTAQEPNSPAMVIFDAEEEYENLGDIPSTAESAETMRKLNIRPLNPDDFEVITIGENHGHCLTLTSIDPLHLSYFLHQLQPATFTQLQRLIQDIKNDNPRREFTFPELRTEIFNYSTRNQYHMHNAVREAISRSLQAISLDLFDIPGRTPIDVTQMMKSGKVTVVDVFNLRDDQQRIVALYILALLHEYNMKSGNIKNSNYPGALFILDEVQRILPQNMANSDYQKRIIQFLGEIHHRGRKRKYGIVYATQSPRDIKKDIIDLCNTKVFFQIQGSGDFLKQYLAKDQIEQLKQLPNGRAFMTCKGKHEPVLVKFPLIN